MKKAEPAVLTMGFTLADGNNYVDLSQCASILNRRFYRQGINWAVAGFRFYKPTPTEVGATGVSVSKLPSTWSMSNGWEKVFRAWKRQQDEVMDDGVQESVKARYNDFKIYADADHMSATNLLPLDASANVAVAGEWDYSNLVVPNFGSPGVNFDAKIFAVGPKVGGVGGGFSIIQLYADSRSTPFSPDPDVPGDVLSTDNILNLMFDAGDNNTDVLTDVIGENNETPYTIDDYPGGDTQLPGLQIVDVGYFNTGTNANKLYLKGDSFPCGLMKIFQNTGDQITMLVDLVPGHHRGYLCEPMTEM